MYYAYIFDIYTHMQEYMYVCMCVCVCVYIYIIYKIYIRYLCIRYLYIHGTYLRVLAFLRICAWAEREELRRELKLREANYTVAKEKFDKLDKEYKEYAEKHKQVHISNKKKNLLPIVGLYTKCTCTSRYTFSQVLPMVIK